MKELTSRERVLLALNHQEADRIPVDFASTRSSGINALAYGALIRHLGLDLENTVFDMKQLLSQVDEKVRQQMGGDVIQLHRLEPSMGVKLNQGMRPEILMDGSEASVPAGFQYETQEDGSFVIRNKEGDVAFKRPETGLYFDDMYHPLAEVDSEDGIDKALEIPQITEEEIAYLKKQGKELFQNTPYAVIGTTSISIFERGFKDFGYENYLIQLMAEPELASYYLNRLTDGYIQVLDKYLDAVGDYIQIIQMHDDFGTQESTLVSPDLYREMLKPWHTKIIGFIKAKRPDIKVFFHCCGAMSTLLPDLIEAGIDIINPIQLSAAGMDPVMLKKEYGKEITFWGGGCSTQSTMTFGKPADVRAEAQKLIKILAPGGGFVFCQDHNIQPNVSPENIVALYQAIQDFGQYPIV